VLKLGADFPKPVVARPLPSGELAPRLGLLLTAQVTPTPSAAALPLFAGITLVAVYRPILLADQAVHHLGVVNVPGVTAAVCTRPLSASTPTCAFMPKYH
jgi:hypothetical protein